MHHDKHGPAGHGHGGHHHAGHGHGHHGSATETGLHDRGRYCSCAGRPPSTTPQQTSPGRSAVFPAPEDCPKQGGTADCGRECRTCPNRGL